MSIPQPSEDAYSDADLIEAARAGSTTAYGELYGRHLGAARALSRHLCSSHAEADDAVSEAFAKVLQALRAGRGPTEAFRAYLLRTVRNCVYDKGRRDRRLTFTDDMEAHSPAEPFVDQAELDLDRSLAARAFGRLPERWQAVLWHTAIEEQPPHEVAKILGITPNNVTSLAYRAREGLRAAYLDVYLAGQHDPACENYVRQLGSDVRGTLSRTKHGRLEDHLAECEACSRLHGELRDVSHTMRSVIGPVVLGAAAAAYLAERSHAAGLVSQVGAAGVELARTSQLPWWKAAAGAAAVLVAVGGGVLLLPDPPSASIAAPRSPAPADDVQEVPDRVGPDRSAPEITGPPAVPDAEGVAQVIEPEPTVDLREQEYPSPARTAQPPDPVVAAPAPPVVAPAPSTTPPAPPPAAAREVGLVLGEPVMEYALTTVPVTVTNRSGDTGNPVIVLALPPRTHVSGAGGDACAIASTGTSVQLNCADVPNGGSRTVSLQIAPDDNGDGTFSDQEGPLDADAALGDLTASANRYIRVVCE